MFVLKNKRKKLEWKNGLEVEFISLVNMLGAPFYLYASIWGLNRMVAILRTYIFVRKYFLETKLWILFYGYIWW